MPSVIKYWPTMISSCISGPRELSGAVDLISRYKLLNHHSFFCKKPLPLAISDTNYLNNVVGDTEIRKGEGMELDQLFQNSYPNEKTAYIQPFDMETLGQAFQLRETAPVDLPSVRYILFGIFMYLVVLTLPSYWSNLHSKQAEKGTPTISGKPKIKSKDKVKKHKKHKEKDRDKEKEQKKHKHRHKDRSKDKDKDKDKDKEKKKDKSGNHESGGDHSKKHEKVTNQSHLF